MKNAPVALIASAAASGTITSTGVYLGNVYAYSMHLIAAAGGTGSVVIQVSNDDVQISSGTNPSNLVVNWTPVSSGTMTVSGAGSSISNFDGVGYSWVRAVYTATGGTAVMNLNYFGKGA